MKTIDDVLNYSMFVNNDPKLRLRLINLPNYYNFSEMLDTFKNCCNTKYLKDNEVNPEITVIATTKYNYKTAIKKGFHTVYLYDIIDFTDNNFYPKVNIQGSYVILESGDNVTPLLIQRLFNEALDVRSYFFVFYDKFIQRRYDLTPEDVMFLRTEDNYEIEKVKGDKNNIAINLNHYLNNIRSKNQTLEDVLKKDNTAVTRIEIDTFDLYQYLDVSKVIITSSPSMMRQLNIKIRDMLGFMNDDPLQPKPNEYLISLSPAEVVDFTTGKNIILPIGSRIKVTKSEMMSDGTGYKVYFLYELADGSVSECLVKISRAYLNYMVNNGDLSLIHNQNTYLFYYGYVIGDYYSLNEKYEDAIVICDITTGDKRDLYTALLPISNNATIYYNLDKKIIY